MQGVKSTEYEVAACYSDDFSITVVLGRDDPDDKAVAAIRCAAQPLLINGVKRIGIASGTCIACCFFIITNHIE